MADDEWDAIPAGCRICPCKSTLVEGVAAEGIAADPNNALMFCGSKPQALLVQGERYQAPPADPQS